MILLFADTLIEDQDLYRFLDDSSAQLGVPVTRVCDGRTPFEVYWDQSFLGNSRIAPCSYWLKQKPCKDWLKANLDPEETILYVGIDGSRRERLRMPGIQAGWKGWEVRFPLADHPTLDKELMLAWCRQLGVEPPRLYELGYSHNNCGGNCVRAGQQHWRHHARTLPDRFADYEKREQEFRDAYGDVAILKRTTKGVVAPLTLKTLREELEAA
jgi:hypothetical protein